MYVYLYIYIMYCMWMYLSIYIYLHVRINIHIVYLYFKKHLHSCCMLLSRFPASFKKTFGWFWRLPLGSFGKKTPVFTEKTLKLLQNDGLKKKNSKKFIFWNFQNLRFLASKPPPCFVGFPWFHPVDFIKWGTHQPAPSHSFLRDPWILGPQDGQIRGIIKPWDDRVRLLRMGLC